MSSFYKHDLILPRNYEEAHCRDIVTQTTVSEVQNTHVL